jgi:hypothetical protein
MMDAQFVFKPSDIVALCGLITAVYAVYKIMKQANKPYDDLRKTVEKHSQILDNDNKRLKATEEDNKMILQALLVIVNHSVDGNGIDKLKETRTELQEYLIKR